MQGFFIWSVMDLSKYTNNIATPDNYEELGILQFAKDFWPKRFESKPALLHYEMALMLFQLLDPRKQFAFERQRYFLVHREAAKSTFGSFLLPMYVIYMRGKQITVDERMLSWNPSDKTIQQHYEDAVARRGIKFTINEDFIVIASETATRAERFVHSLKEEIEKRSDMVSLFGEKDPRIIDLEQDQRKKSKNVWRVNSFITADKTVVFGIGAGQRIRGANEGGNRPSLIIVDDMYSGQNTKTETNRENSSYWFHAELLNSLDSRKGKCLWLGTMVHPDTVVKDFRMDNDWQGVERPIISTDELKAVIDEITVNKVIQIPEREVCDKIPVKTLSWPERHPLYSILKRYKKHFDKNKLNYFYQEFMNEAIAPELKLIGPQAFYKTDIYHRVQDGRNVIEFDYEGYHWIGVANLVAAMDPASSQALTSDDTVIVVTGLARMYPRTAGFDYQQTEKGRSRVFPIIMHIEGGKYSIRPYEQMKSMATSLLSIDRLYKLNYINIETIQAQEQILREISTIFKENKRTTTLWPAISQQNKAERIISTIVPMLHKYNVCICCRSTFIDTLYNQLLTVGVADHDDYPDALAIGWKAIEEPTDHMYYDDDNSPSTEITRLQILKQQFGDDYWMYV